jgi:hypothetical protein
LTGALGQAHNGHVSGALFNGRVSRELIDELVAEGASLKDIERDVIDESPLGEDSRDALWLYAWGSIERQRSPVLTS